MAKRFKGMRRQLLTPAARALREAYKGESTYGAEITVVDGIKFASRIEAKRYGELLYLQMGGEISELQVHPVFQVEYNGVKFPKIVGDFQYIENGKTVVEDTKVRVTDTALSQLKRAIIAAHRPDLDWRVLYADRCR